MPLNVQTTAIPMVGGVDTKDDPFQISTGKLLVAENVVFTNPGRLDKRDGTQNLPNTVLGGPALTAGTSIATFQGELVVTDKSNLYSYDESGQTLIDKGAFYSPTIELSSVVRTQYSQTAQDQCVHPSGLSLVAYESTGITYNGAYYTIIDTGTGQIIQPPTLIGATAIKPKTLVMGNFFALLWYDTAAASSGQPGKKINGALIPIGTPTAALSPQQLTDAGAVDTAPYATTPSYDATVISDAVATPQLYIAFNNGYTPSSYAGGLTVNNYTALSWPSLNPITTQLKIASHPAAVVSIFEDLNERGPVIAYSKNVAESTYAHIRFVAYDWTLTTLFGSGSFDAIYASSTFYALDSITGISRSASSVDLQIFYSFPAISGESARLDAQPITTGSYTLGSGVNVLRNAEQATKPFTYGGVSFLVAAFQTALQPTYFIVTDQGMVIGRILYGNGGGLVVPNPVLVAASVAYGSVMMPEVTTNESAVFILAVQQIARLTTVGGSVETVPGVSSLVVDFFSDQASYSSVELGRNLNFGGALPVAYDGVSVVEIGFNYYPEGITVTTASGSNLISGKEYGYCSCYARTDNQGQIHRSTPSPIVSITPSGNKSGVIVVPSYQITNATAESPDIIELYRTEGDGEVFYLQTSVVAPVINDPTVDFVTIDDTVTDATLIGNPQLYTTGGVLSNSPPPPLASLIVHYNRLAGVSMENPLQLWFTKQAVPGTAPEFSLSFTQNIDPRGGPVTSLATMDDKWIVFRENSVFYILGTGPDPSGINNQFPDAIRATTDTGCMNERSIVAVPDGLMFKSPKGIYLLGRDLTTSYIGADVEAYNGETVTSALIMSDRNEVRFTLQSGVVLVYNYFVRQWSVFTNLNAADSTLWQNLWAIVTPTGQILQETPGVFTDSGQLIPLKVTTPWLQFAGVQGYQRIYKLLLLGTYKSPHQLLVSLAYDFNPNPIQQDTITPAALTTWGSTSTWGAIGSVWGGAYPLYQWRVFPQQQKCQAMQITIQDTASGLSPGESLSLSSLGLEFGMLGKLRRMPAASSFG